MIYKQLEKNGLRLPALGQGVGLYAWDDSHIDTMREGVDLGMNFFDTAEGYDNGNSERIIGRAIRGIRDKVIVGTKFSPENSGRGDVVAAAEASLNRLGTDYIDLYQIHWPNPAFPLEETIRGMEDLKRQGKVRHIGVGNQYLEELSEARALAEGPVASIQLEYNLFDRMVEEEILPFCWENHMFLLAYSPIDQGRIADGPRRREAVERIAAKYEKTPAQVALRWLIHRPEVVAIPKASNRKHLRQRRGCGFRVGRRGSPRHRRGLPAADPPNPPQRHPGQPPGTEQPEGLPDRRGSPRKRHGQRAQPLRFGHNHGEGPRHQAGAADRKSGRGRRPPLPPGGGPHPLLGLGHRPRQSSDPLLHPGGLGLSNRV